MSDFSKIQHYYQGFDEWSRLDTPAGQLELVIMLELINEHIAPNSSIFDLGGGAGRYSYELALHGYRMHLADLSPDLIATARQKLSDFPGKDNIKSIGTANALDLSEIAAATHDNVLLFGPLYHLTRPDEIRQCLREVHRVMKPGGKIMAAYIPYHCGVVSILERAFRSLGQVNSDAFRRVFQYGIFNNQSDTGFQEGNYLKSASLIALMEEQGFKKSLVRSIRGIGYQQEGQLLQLAIEQPEFYREVIHALHQTATDDAIVETCGHAIFIGEKM